MRPDTPEEAKAWRERPALHANHKTHQDYCINCWMDMAATCKVAIEKLTDALVEARKSLAAAYLAERAKVEKCERMVRGVFADYRKRSCDYPLTCLDSICREQRERIDNDEKNILATILPRQEQEKGSREERREERQIHLDSRIL